MKVTREREWERGWRGRRKKKEKEEAKHNNNIPRVQMWIEIPQR